MNEETNKAETLRRKFDREITHTLHGLISPADAFRWFYAHLEEEKQRRVEAENLLKFIKGNCYTVGYVKFDIINHFKKNGEKL